MKDSIFHNADIISPAYVYDQGWIMSVLDRLATLKAKTGCLPLYSIKSANTIGLLELIKPHVSGFSCSSLFEVMIAKEVLDDAQSIHITTPGFKENEIEKISNLSDFVTLNSLSQMERYATSINIDASCGLRINPEMSFVNDERYDPCRADSKLGVTLTKLARANENKTINWKLIDGIHIHNNCESTNFNELKSSIENVLYGLSAYPLQLKWINLGGGYLLEEETDLGPLEEAVSWLQDNYQVTVYIEPGKAITGWAGYLVATVIDLFETENKTVAVLDTCINHLPEVFEYQYQPQILNSSSIGDHRYSLTGCSCLSGDLFGDYSFEKPLNIGSRIIFENVGAYMQVKANMFNGINLPTTYLLDDGEFELIKGYDFESFFSRL